MRSSEVAERLGVSLRKLQWWDERGFVKPAHVDGNREYSEVDFRDVTILRDIRNRGIAGPALRKSFRIARQSDARFLMISNGRHKATEVQVAKDVHELANVLVKFEGSVMVVGIPAKVEESQ
jgi:DNA-binding transcriptional MerR regulator